MQYKNVYEDFYWTATGDTGTSVVYQIQDEGGSPIFNGKAYIGSGGQARVNVAQKIRDWLENEIGDFREANGVFFDHPDAIHAFSLLVGGEVQEQWMVIFSFEPWDGGTYLFTTAINTHASPLQKLFLTNGSKKGLPTQRTQTITDGGEGDGPGGESGQTDFFIVDRYINVPWDAGSVTVSVLSSYNLNNVEISTPEGVTAVRIGNNVTFSFPENRSDSSRTYYITWNLNWTTFLAQTDIIVGVMELDDPREYDYLTLEILTGGTLTQRIDQGLSLLEFSVNGGPWEKADEWDTFRDDTYHTDGDFDVPTGGVTNYLYGKRTFVQGDIVRLRHDRRDGPSHYAGNLLWDGYQNKFQCGIKANVYGNVASVLFGEEFRGVHTISDELALEYYSSSSLFSVLNFSNLFSIPNGSYLRGFCVEIVNSNNLVLPFTRVSDHCHWMYRTMFMNQTTLLTAPDRIPLQRVPSCGLQDMYSGCENLTEAPVIDAVELSDLPWSVPIVITGTTAGTINTYAHMASMFKDCANLQTPPPMLKPRTLGYGSYATMFSGCTALQRTPVIYADSVLSGESASFANMYEGCENLTEVAIPPIAKAVLNAVCSGCTSLRSFTCYVSDAFYASRPDNMQRVLSDVSASGVIHTPPSVHWWQNSGLVPNGWSVVADAPER